MPNTLMPTVAAALALLIPGAAAAVPTPEAAADAYTRMLEARYGAEPIPLPAEGLTFTRDTATWTLTDGFVRLAEPTAEGHLAGLVFEGTGRFRMTIPDPVELRQVQRMAEDRGLELIDTPFSSAVLRTSEDLVAALLPGTAHARYEPSALARARQANWLEHRFADIDARVACGRMIPGDQLLVIEMDTERFGWLTYTYDGLAPEEIGLSHWHPRYKRSESWVALDRPEDRDDDGRPATERRRLIDLHHVDVTADVTKASRKHSRVGQAQFNPRHGVYAVEITFTVRRGGAHALPLRLTPWAEVQAVSEDGRPLRFLRDHIGDRASSLDDMLYDDDLVVLLDRPLAAGETRRLRFEYEQMTLNYLPGGSWYPGPPEVFMDPHTGRFTITSEDRFTIFAMGEEVETTDHKGLRTTVWEVDEPTRMLTFAFADQRTTVQRMEHDGLPEVVAFGPTHEDQMWNVAADTVNSLGYFERIFDQPLDAERLFVTGILGGHGQSFEGFIHMGEGSMHVETEGSTELFRAHEVAHQWWGHEVAWRSYRDQWLSEAFASFSAMLFMQATMDNGQRMYDDLVAAYVGNLTGHAKPTKFGTFVNQRNDKERARLGPISVGYRASTAGTGSGYFAQTYQKGALVLHMLRNLLHHMTKNDDAFFDVMRRFIDTHENEAATTQDFIDTLTAVAPADWQWFFDQWVDGTDIPTYHWSWQATTQDGKPALRLAVEQQNVGHGFRMPVPVHVDLGKGREGQVIVMVDEPEETFTIPLPAKPRKVTLNPGNAVLAVTKKR